MTPRSRCQHAFRPLNTLSIRRRSPGSHSGASPGARARRGSTGGPLKPRSWRTFVTQRDTSQSACKRLWLRSRPCLGVVLLLGVANMAGADELKPFEASYAWLWHGLNVAVSTLTLQKSGDTWSYSSKSEPGGIGKAFSERPVQKSVLRVTDAGVQPLSYQASDGTASTRRAIDVKYDWDHGRVSGVYEDEKVDLPLTPGVQDDASVQVAVMVELLRGRTPERFTLLNKNAVRQYRYSREGEATLQTPLGNIATVIYKSERDGAPRVTRFWCAPDQGYVPLRVQQTRGQDVEWTMEIRSLKRE